MENNDELSALYAPVDLSSTVLIGKDCILGYPKEARIISSLESSNFSLNSERVSIGDHCILFNQIIIYEGVHIEDDCIIEDRVRIGYNSRIGQKSRLTYGAYICDRVVIGSDTCIAGFVCDGVSIGNRSTMMGNLVHEYTSPHQDWWEVDEEPPIIESDTIIGYGATVVGGVKIGPRSYVGAGAVVTEDVPPDHVVVGVNQRTPVEQCREAS